MEVEDIGYTAPTYFVNKINQNTKVCKHVYQKIQNNVKASFRFFFRVPESNLSKKRADPKKE